MSDEQFLSGCRDDLVRAREARERLLTAPSSSLRTIDDTLEPLHEALVLIGEVRARGSLYAEVHPSAEMRAAAETADREGMALHTEILLDRRVYDAVSAVPAEAGDAATQRFRAHLVRDFRRAGVDKDDATRARLKELADRELELGQELDRNIRSDVGRLKLRPEQLRGLPPDYVAGHPPGVDGLVEITTDTPDAAPFRLYAEDADARRALYVASLTRGWPKNTEVLRALFAVRRERAHLLGHPSFADHVTEDKMVRSAAAVAAFIDEVSAVAEARAARDLSALLARKQKDEPGATSVEDWEKAYWEERLKREQAAFDSQSVRPYFEFQRTLDGLLAITAHLYDLTYLPVAGDAAGAWHPDVQVFDVLRGDERLGRIYLDLHPRENKYKHAAQFTLKSGIRGRTLPEGVLVCNFADPKKHSPALLDHSDVETLFHELGHLLHHILGGHQRWVTQSGVATEWDFVEAPSQMFEEWAWDPAVLASFARHHETGDPIPAELVARMRAAAEIGKGLWVRHQMFYAALSLETHLADDPASLDLAALVPALQARYSNFPHVPGTHFETSFGHLNGYSAMYYTYMWSLVIAKDLFAPFEEAGLMDRATSFRYRDAILAPGGSKDAADLVATFLGRPYSFDAFRAWLTR